MAETRLRKRIMHRSEDLLEIVADVEKYPNFINPISALRVKDRKQISSDVEAFNAEATISYKFISEKFKSNVTVDRHKKTISVVKSGNGGAVKDLDNNWIFHELSDGSTVVDFYVKVKLKAFPLEMLLRDKFDKAGDQIMGLFVNHAGETLEPVGNPELYWRNELKERGIPVS